MTDYRYRLERSWAFGEGTVVWCMLNPSTADDNLDDPTIRRVRRFSQDAGFARLVVVNLFAARATKPDALLTIDDPRGPDNIGAIEEAIAEAELVVAAWGAWLHAPLAGSPGLLKLPRLNIEGICWDQGKPIGCLGVTKAGHPRHPLYVRADQRIVPFVTASVCGVTIASHAAKSAARDWWRLPLQG